MNRSGTAVEEPSRRRGGLAATVLATVCGNLFLVLGTLVLGVLACLIGLVDRSGNIFFRLGQFWSWGIVRTSGLRIRAEYPPQLDSTSPVIYMVNHQSLFDIPVLLVSLPGQTRMLAKESLFRIPIFGWAMRLGGFISIDRKDRSRAKESLDEAAERLRGGRSALLFPEGTRSLDGNVAPFHRGGFLLALRSGLPIVPIGIEGTLDVQPKSSFAIRPHDIVVRYGEPIGVADLGIRDRAALTERVRSAVAQLARTELAQ